MPPSSVATRLMPRRKAPRAGNASVARERGRHVQESGTCLKALFSQKGISAHWDDRGK